MYSILFAAKLSTGRNQKVRSSKDPLPHRVSVVNIRAPMSLVLTCVCCLARVGGSSSAKANAEVSGDVEGGDMYEAVEDYDNPDGNDSVSTAGD